MKLTAEQKAHIEASIRLHRLEALRTKDIGTKFRLQGRITAYEVLLETSTITP